MSKQYKTVSLSDEQRIALEALCRRRKADALVWKRARAFLLLDAGEDAGTVCRILDIGPTVLTEWRFAFAGAGLSFFGLKDYSQRQGHLTNWADYNEGLRRRQQASLLFQTNQKILLVSGTEEIQMDGHKMQALLFEMTPRDGHEEHYFRHAATRCCATAIVAVSIPV